MSNDIPDDAQELADALNEGSGSKRAEPYERGVKLYLPEGGFGFGYFPGEADADDDVGASHVMGNIRAYYNFRLMDCVGMEDVNISEEKRNEYPNASFMLVLTFERFLAPDGHQDARPVTQLEEDT